MTSNTNVAQLGRRRALHAIATAAALGLAAAAGGSALAQQAMPGMGGADQGGTMGMGGMPGMMAQGMQGMMGMMPGLMGPESDRLFIQEMIGHHQGAVAMATVAWGQAEHPEVKQLAEAIVKAQNEEVEQMARWFRAWFNAAVAPGEMPLMMAQMGMTAEALKGARPADRAFIEMMSTHHQLAVEMAAIALPFAQHDELARAQQKIVEDQAREIAQMRTWRRAWYPA